MRTRHRLTLTGSAVLTSALTAVLAVGAITEPMSPAADDAATDATAPDDDVSVLVARLTGVSDATAGVAAEGTLQVILRRDPFQPVVPVADDSTSDGIVVDDGSGDGSGGGSGDGSGGGSGDGSGGGTTDAACTGGTAETVCDGTVVTLVSATDDEAVVQVDTTQYVVAEGAVFATSFLLTSLDPPCVTLQYGDETFAVCEGATVLK